MKGFLVSGEKNECYGCGACMQTCPVKAITMEEDDEGFLYPFINNNLCISCNKCHSVCPIEANLTLNKPMQAHVGFCVSIDKRRKSASGGAFYAITKVSTPDTTVFGVEWKSRSSARHEKRDVDTAYERFSKSKYVQSDIGNSYIETKQELLMGKSVVFTGTPCQIAGLKTFLGKDYENLLCVDLVCHGVPSGKVLECYINDNEGKEKIEGIDFRHKVYKKGEWQSKCAVLKYKSGKRKVVDYDTSGFLRGFACGLFFRPSCATCQFACQERVSDLTIGDAWGIEKIRPEMNPHEGISLILVNGEKGDSWRKKMESFMQMEEVDFDILVEGNARLREPDRGHSKRKEFFENLCNTSFEKLVQMYIPRISYIRKIGHLIKKYLLGQNSGRKR